MKDKRRSIASTNCVTTAASCIKWDGPDIPCLDICNGDELTDVIHAIAAQICAAIGVTDFSTLSLQCLVDKLGVTLPTERTLINLLQLAFDNDCKLKDLIDDIEDLIIDPNAELDLNMGCLEVLDGFGNPIPVTQMSLNQTLVTQFCILKIDIVAIQATLIDLQNQIDAIDIDPYEEPILNTCLFPALSVSQQIIQGFSQICTFESAVGTIGDIQTAVGTMPPDIQIEYQTNPSWQLNPINLAQSDTNQWVVITDLLNRMAEIEACACQFKCSDITIGFLTTFEDDGTVTINFTAGAGTFIPLGWLDCGSKITIMNQNNVSFGPINIVISQEGEVTGIDISSFTLGDTLTFSLDVKLCNAELGRQCDKCVGKTVIYKTTGCCTVTNTGEDNVIIIYTLCS